MDRKNILRRLPVVLCCIVMLLCCMISPAFAATSSGYSYALFQFDYIENFKRDNSGSIIFPWCFNSFPSSSDALISSRVDVAQYYYTYSLVYDEPYWGTSLNFNFDMSGDGLIWELHRSDLYISKVDLRNGEYSFNLMPGSSAMADYSISFYLMYFENYGGAYREFGEFITISGSDVYFDLAELVYEAIVASGFDTGDYYHLHDLTVTLSNVVGLEDWGICTTTTYAIPSGYHYVNGQTLAVTEETIIVNPDGSASSGSADPAFSFGWLTSSVSSFLEMELWPNFTLGGALRIAFIIGLLFFFLKVSV